MGEFRPTALPLSSAMVLDTWERAMPLPPVARALTLLAATTGDPPDQLAGLSIGRRDAGLLALRCRLFGSQFRCLADCLSCHAPLDVDFDLADLASETDEPPDVLDLEVQGFMLRYRPPNSRDLVALGPTDGPEHLLGRCILDARAGDEPVLPSELPPAVLNEVAAAMALSDPLADIQLALACPACGHRWLAAFDIVSFLWTEIDAWSGRALDEVHVLAQAYGWNESEVLALSPWRRQHYLDRIGR